MRYVALLRGINVGGKNLIKMKELAAQFSDAGFRDVVTYIQSGNVLFTSSESGRAKLTLKIEALLAAMSSSTIAAKSSAVLKTRPQMRQIVDGAPKGFGTQPTLYRYDVIFLKEPLTAAVAMKSVSLREGVDEACSGKGVIYFARLSSKAAQSRLPKLVSMPVYKEMTIRNWNTTTALLRLMDATRQ